MHLSRWSSTDRTQKSGKALNPSDFRFTKYTMGWKISIGLVYKVKLGISFSLASMHRNYYNRGNPAYYQACSESKRT